MLFIGFAREDEEIESIYERDKKSLLAQTDTNIVVVNATHQDLSEQIKLAKSIYITGGDTRKLLEEVGQHSDFVKLLNGKTIAGSSAGANLFSRFYFSTSLGCICEGLGVLQLSLVCHYGNAEMGVDENAIALLKNNSNTLNVVTLAEQAFRTFEVDLTD